MNGSRSVHLKLCDKEKEQVVKARRDGVTVKNICTRFGIGPRYVYDLCERAGFPTKKVKYDNARV